MLKQNFARLTTGAAMAALLVSPSLSNAQSWKYLDPVPTGTTIQVRTTEPSTPDHGRTYYKGIVETDVRDARVAAIPRGANGGTRRSARRG